MVESGFKERESPGIDPPGGLSKYQHFVYYCFSIDSGMIKIWEAFEHTVEIGEFNLASPNVDEEVLQFLIEKEKNR